MLSMNLETIIGTKGRISILRKLCESPECDYSISELAETVNIDKSLVSRVITELEKEKIVNIHTRRNLKLCQININNSVYHLLTDVFSSEKKNNGNNITRPSQQGKRAIHRITGSAIQSPAIRKKVRFPWST